MGPALLSALLLGLAQPPFFVPGLPFLALAPLAAALGRGTRAGVGEDGMGGASLGAAFGFLFWTLELIWIPAVVGPTFSWAFPGYLAMVVLLTGLGALMGETVRRMHREGGVPLPLAFSVGWVGVEWVRGNLPFGLAWPWLGLGLTLSRSPSLMGWAAWVGETGLSLGLAWVNGWVAAGVLRLGEGRWGGRGGWLRVTAPWLGAGGLVFLFTWLGNQTAVRVAASGIGAGPRVAVVGTAVGVEGRGRSPGEHASRAMEQAERALQEVAPGTVDLVVLPEGTIPVPLNLPAAAPFRARLEKLARELGAPILVGAVVEDSPESRPEGLEGLRWKTVPRTNSAVLIPPTRTFSTDDQETTPPGGMDFGREGFPYRYDKVRLVPGMEWGGFRRGTEVQVLSLGGWRFGVLICYESLFPSLSRDLRRQGAQYLINLTSDRWLGKPDRVWGRWFLEQHPPHLAMRASENRTPAVRAANSGVSLVVDGAGRPVARHGPGSGVLVAELPPPLPPASGGSWGGKLGPLVLVLGLVLLMARRKPEC